MLTREDIDRRFGDLTAALRDHNEKSDERHKRSTGEIGARLAEVEKLIAEGRLGSSQFSAGDHVTPGRVVSDSAEFKSFGGSQKRGKFSVSVKTITSLSTSGGAMAPPDRSATPALMGRRTLTVRQLLGSVPTSSNMIEYPRQSVRTNAAAVVTEGSEKPESAIEFTLQTAPVRTVAHWIPASRQILDDAPQLGDVIDSELRYGLALEIEDELLNGDGTGAHILGIIPQATDYNSAFSVEAQTNFDILLKAILQSELAGFPANVMVLHPTDLARLISIKDNDERYIASAGPFSGPLSTIWNVPVAASQAMTEGDFLVGSTFATTVYDRMQAEVVVSTEHSDYFIRNLVAVRAEERLALAVKRPEFVDRRYVRLGDIAVIDRHRLDEAQVRTLADADDLIRQWPATRTMLDACYWAAADGAISVADCERCAVLLVAWMRRELIDRAGH